MRILYITTIAGTMPFFKAFIKDLRNKGYEVDLACNRKDSSVLDDFLEWGCGFIPILCERNLFRFGNLWSIKQIREIVESRKYDIIHCHTPIASVCTRISLRKVRNCGVRVIYTAHGFHFYKGAPIKNWLIYFPVEWICSWWTDLLITINREDYNRAQRMLHAKYTAYIPGVGVNISLFKDMSVNIENKLEALGIPKGSRIVLSVGELNANKNHESVIRAISQIRDNKIHYIIAGKGILEKYFQQLALDLKISDRIHLLGYRDDIKELYKCADLLIHPSFREGLSVTIMEAMAAQVPIVCSDIRGNRDFISSEFRFLPYNIEDI